MFHFYTTCSSKTGITCQAVLGSRAKDRLRYKHWVSLVEQHTFSLSLSLRIPSSPRTHQPTHPPFFPFFLFFPVFFLTVIGFPPHSDRESETGSMPLNGSLYKHILVPCMFGLHVQGAENSPHVVHSAQMNTARNNFVFIWPQSSVLHMLFESGTAL